mgnify:CR=1 FL=1
MEAAAIGIGLGEGLPHAEFDAAGAVGKNLARLERAVGQAEAKGAKDSLILLDELALVVSVQNRTVVTAMDESSSKEHVFTNIDSVVFAP